jgi:hypothetical protein
VNTSVLELLAGVYDVKDPDPVLLGVIGDRLEEMGRLDLKWILAGACPYCGGRLRYPAQQDINTGRWRRPIPFLTVVKRKSKSGLAECPVCDQCGNEDTEATPFAYSMVCRVVRLLGMARCDSPNHFACRIGPASGRKIYDVWEPRPDCPRCKGHSFARVRSEVK